MKVLSLFDGISCGRIALERAGIPVEKYYASEIDKYAEKISQANYPDIIRLGDVTKWREWDIEQPDLILAGSPCQGFSFAGKQLNFSDPRSSLFFEFVNILNRYKPKYFLLENVKMKKEYQSVISHILGCEPVEINSALVSAQNRKRLYWTNIPATTEIEDVGSVLWDVIEDGTVADCHYPTEYKRARPRFRRNLKNTTGKAGCLLASIYKGFEANGMPCFVDKGGVERKATPLECERLQTLPDNYTAHVSNTQRYKAIGNGWTVDIISHILKGILYEG